jgi:hypothetical protein
LGVAPFKFVGFHQSVYRALPDAPAHPGDGADYGFWFFDNIEDEFDGPKVSDLRNVPKGYMGEILLFNDHGNVSLYQKVKTQKPRKIWSMVV